MRKAVAVKLRLALDVLQTVAGDRLIAEVRSRAIKPGALLSNGRPLLAVCAAFEAIRHLSNLLRVIPVGEIGLACLNRNSKRKV